MAKSYPSQISVSRFTDEMYARARKKVKKATPLDVVGARYDRKNDMICLDLRKGVQVKLPRSQVRELARASKDDVAKIEIQPGGDGITFRRINADIYVPGLLAEELAGLFGRAMGKKARGHTSKRKAKASRENGRKGGRPKKLIAA